MTINEKEDVVTELQSLLDLFEQVEVRFEESFTVATEVPLDEKHPSGAQFGFRRIGDIWSLYLTHVPGKSPEKRVRLVDGGVPKSMRLTAVNRLDALHAALINAERESAVGVQVAKDRITDFLARLERQR